MVNPTDIITLLRSRKLSLLVVSAAISLLTPLKSAQAITITPTNSGTTLANTILGSGITIVPGSLSYTGADGASGTFTDGLSSGVGIENGIILTTGQAIDGEGPNSADGTSTVNGFSGDPDLDALGFSTLDATILEFEFESEGGDLFFNYVFASEEYNEFVNSAFNDVFAFFLNGVNIALIPGTTTPVAINTVNNGNPFGTGASNPQFFNNNDLSDGGPFFDIEYDGFTTIFTAQALGLTPGTQSIKIAIADAGDSSLDSAVFIQASTFSDVVTPSTPSVPEPSSILGLLGFAALATQKVGKKNKQK